MSLRRISGAYLALLIALAMLGPITLNIITPALPKLPAALATSREAAQLTLSLYLVGLAISQMLLGPLADRYGRRPIILVSIGTYVIASIAAEFAPDIETLIVARLAQSFGASSGLVLGRTMIRDQYDLSTSASLIGYVTMAMTIAPMIAPLLGAQLMEAFGWRSIFTFCALFGAVSFAIAVLRLPETRPASLEAATARDVLARTGELIRNRRYLMYWASSAFSSALFFGLLGAAPYLVIDAMGRSGREYGLWFASLGLGYMLGNFVSARGGILLGIGRLIWLGALAGLAGATLMLVLALSLPLHPAFLFLPAMLVSLGNGMLLPNAMAGGIGVDPKAAGAGSGLMGFGQLGVSAIVSFFTASYSKASSVPMAAILVACAIVSVWASRACRHDLARKA
jgi:DHA1 family bicyclomycin/chloramphenicol resistance-like MFS transporter